MTFNSFYPIVPPKRLFVDTGMVDLQIFKSWSPTCSVKHILFAIREMLTDPQTMMNYYSSHIRCEAISLIASPSEIEQPNVEGTPNQAANNSIMLVAAALARSVQVSMAAAKPSGRSKLIQYQTNSIRTTSVGFARLQWLSHVSTYSERTKHLNEWIY